MSLKVALFCLASVPLTQYSFGQFEQTLTTSLGFGTFDFAEGSSSQFSLENNNSARLTGRFSVDYSSRPQSAPLLFDGGLAIESLIELHSTSTSFLAKSHVGFNFLLDKDRWILAFGIGAFMALKTTPHQVYQPSSEFYNIEISNPRFGAYFGPKLFIKIGEKYRLQLKITMSRLPNFALEEKFGHGKPQIFRYPLIQNYVSIGWSRII